MDLCASERGAGAWEGGREKTLRLGFLMLEVRRKEREGGSDAAGLLSSLSLSISPFREENGRAAFSRKPCSLSSALGWGSRQRRSEFFRFVEVEVKPPPSLLRFVFFLPKKMPRFSEETRLTSQIRCPKCRRATSSLDGSSFLELGLAETPSSCCLSCGFVFDDAIGIDAGANWRSRPPPTALAFPNSILLG